MPVSAEALFAWHERPGAFERLAPPWQPVRLDAFEGIREGDRAVIKMGTGPLSVPWIAEHFGYRPGRRFSDRQLSGPFASWTHTHRMHPRGADASLLEDYIAYRLPLSPLTAPLAGRLAEDRLDRLFAYRHRVTATDLARHRAAASSALCIAITGSSGLLGSSLTAFLRTGGHRVVRLVRPGSPRSDDAIRWDPAHDLVDETALAAAAPDVVIHLAGESVYAPYWTVEKRRRIWESRVRSTALLSRALARMDRRPRVLLSASGSGYYGDQGAHSLTETAPSGDGFLAGVCRAWEAATDPAEQVGIRTVHLRLGVVLTPAGGALGLIQPLFLAGLGGRLVPDDPFLPWIALDDVLYGVLHLIDASLHGPVNLGAPSPATARAFADALGRTLRRPAWLPLPLPALSLLGGDLVRETVCTSTRMVPQRLTEDGFSFAYPTLDDALGHVLGTSSRYPTTPAETPSP